MSFREGPVSPRRTRRPQPGGETRAGSSEHGASEVSHASKLSKRVPARSRTVGAAAGLCPPSAVSVSRWYQAGGGLAGGRSPVSSFRLIAAATRARSRRQMRTLSIKLLAKLRRIAKLTPVTAGCVPTLARKTRIARPTSRTSGCAVAAPIRARFAHRRAARAASCVSTACLRLARRSSQRTKTSAANVNVLPTCDATQAAAVSKRAASAATVVRTRTARRTTAARS